MKTTKENKAPTASPTERELIRLAAQGDQNAFEQLIAPYSRRIYNIGLRMLGNSEDAADMTQESLLKIYRHLGSFRGDATFSTWLYRISVNTCNDILRSASRRNERAFSDLYGEDGDEPEVADYTELPEQVYADKECAAYLRALIDGLSPRYRLVMTLRELGGLSYQEIAAAAKISEGTVKSRINRARAAMRRQAEADMEHFPYLNSLIRQQGGQDE